MLISILTGILAGAIHVIGGPDHLLAIAPAAFQKPRLALRNGLAWGVGHSTGIISLSVLAIFLKDLAHIQRMSFLAEFFVGVILLVLGVVAIKTSLGLKIHTHKHNHGLKDSHQHLHLHFRGNKKHYRHSHAATSLGVLHGFAGATHLLVIIPALALPPIGAFIYMFSYILGSIFAMTFVTVAMSLATLKAGQKVLPLIMRTTGILSVLTGSFWIQRTSSFLL
mgnify:CR=1 FL=1